MTKLLLTVVTLSLCFLASPSVRAEDAPAVVAPAAGDPALGEKVFVKCRACHQIGENAHNSVGPELNGVIGRHSGSVAGYNYSDANKNSGLTWDEATFRDYIKDPKAKVPGTKMSFAGLTKESDINNIVAYLKQFNADGKKP
ncbi:cytochrome c family protein [Lichenihabitans sp. PAMC28606]|uniref:c-type cytochrome n=1 Tax=Lichenihabitans sp. PAMC28606 TaxID=2880932 RepID=UPI001D0A8112|nr:cytochrome c family protein [Lichenihabitans sp. PAMC28606]UDL93178.1 cytochrome c family protein [Lichenihabitans sp. PAMC28606]